MSELLVPIRVDAIRLAHARRVVGPLADYERLPWFDGARDRNASVPHVAAAINAPPFTDHQAWLEAGVHLHWALPDGLTRGATRRTPERTVQVGDLWFPPAPNRWLVLRRNNADATKRIERAWLVESDYVHPPGVRPAAAIAYPRAVARPGAAPFVYLGRQIELAPGTMAPLDPTLARITPETSLTRDEPALTALGSGDPLFAAYYPACRSVFGLHDDARAPAAETTWAYAVYGWYSDGIVEPLASMADALRAEPRTALSLLARAAKEGKVTAPASDPAALTEAQWDDALRLALGERFGWGLTRAAPGTAFPTNLVCAGETTVAPGVEAHEKPVPDAGVVGVGSSPAEAVTALLMGETPLRSTTEDRIAHALAATDLSNHALDLGPKLAEARHTEQFRAYRGHSIWTIRPPEAPDAGPSESGVLLPDELAHELNLLNTLQEEYDRAHDAVNGLRQALFADWSRYMTSAYPEGDVDPFDADVDTIRELVERTRLAPLEALLARTGRLFHGRDAAGSVLLADRHPVEVTGPLPEGAMVGGTDGVDVVAAVDAGERLAGFDVWSGDIIDDVVPVGVRTAFPRHTPGGHLHEVRFAAGEHVTVVYGESGAWSGFHLVSRLGFETNHGRRFGPWGWNPERRTPFRIEAPERMAIVGLRVRTGSYLNAIGILVAPPAHMEGAPEDPGDTLARRVVDQHRVVQTLLAEAARGRQPLTLGPAPGPQFWRPNDPVIVLNDAIATATSRHGNDGRGEPDGLHPCLAIDLTGGWTNSGLAFAGAPRAPLAHTAGAWQLAVHPLSTTHSEGENWHALQLEWEVELQPLEEGSNFATGRFDPRFVTRSHSLPQNGADLVELSGRTRMRTYQYLGGRTILNPAAGRLLLERLEALPQDLASALPKAPESLMVLPLGGFHDQLLMQRQEPQIDIVDPIGLPVQRAFTARVRAAVHGLHPTTPMPDSAFHPIRSGEMLIERLRVIDVFGRTKTWRPERVLTARRMRPAGGAFDRAALPVRFAQAARLDLRWLAAIDGAIESNAHPATSPICGWLLPNELDGEIAVYARTGHFLGSVGAGGVWLPAPGNAATPRSWREMSDLALRRVVRWMTLPSATDAIGSFLEMLDNALEHIDPQDAAQHQARALLIGRPIAVVRARIALALHRPAALDQSMNALRSRLAGGADDSHGLGDVEIPVRLGEHAQLNDGLCGYWIEDGALFRDETFHTPHGVPPGTSHERIRVMGDDPLDRFPIRLTANGGPRFVTMLVDPRGVVHATCGILPAKSIAIPPEQFAGLAADLRATFVTAPVLTAPDEVALPLPTEPGYSWSWIERTGNDWLEVPHHPTVHRADLVAGFGAIGRALWERLVELGRIVPMDHPDIGVLMPGDPLALADRFDDLKLNVAAVERGLHDIARAIGEAGIAATFGSRAVAREGWLQLRRSAQPLPTEPDLAAGTPAGGP